MKRGTIAATAAAAVAFVGVPASMVSAAPASTGSTTTASAAKVAASKWDSYVVLLKDDPLTATFTQGQLNTTRAQARAAAMVAKHDAVVSRAGLAKSTKVQDYTAVLNGFSVLVSHAKAEKIASDPNVLAVLPDQLRQAQSVAATTYGTDAISDSPGESLRSFLGLDGTDTKGDGELLGVIDTGIWPEHPSFADDGTYPKVKLNDRGGFRKCDFGKKGANKDDAPWHCNNKLVGARQMLRTYRAVIGVLPGEYDSARDDEGHGTHTASTAAGDEGVKAWIYDKTKTLDTTTGIAPRAQLIAYKALGSLGGFTSDLAEAIDQAVYDGVDVINYSIGGGPSLTSADAIAFLFANRAGVHVATSAGNSGPNPSTIGGPADLPWVTTVGASTQPRLYAGTIELGNGDSVVGSSVTLGSESDLPVVDAAALDNPLCLSKDQLDDDAKWQTFDDGVDGAMVLCWRGQIGRSAKSYHVMQAGGKAMVLSNQDNVDNYFTDNFRLPTVMVDKSEGDVIADYAKNGENPTATITDTQVIKTFDPAPSMAKFSSRGPNPSAESIIKPDITAPGVEVLAGASPKAIGEDYEPGQLFQAIAGTSMSSPVMAGVFLLEDQLHPSWSPSEVKSAVMTTAYQDVRDNDRTSQADPFDFGSGHVSPVTAFSPGLAYDSGFFDFLGFYCGTDARNLVFSDPDGTCGDLEASGFPTRVEDLNYPTIGVSALAGIETVTRTVTNVSGEAATFTASVDAPAGISVSVEPSSLTLEPGDSASYEVTLTNESAPVDDGWLFGSLTWSGAGQDTRSNVAVYPVALSAPSLVTGSGASGQVSFDVTPGFAATYTSEPGGLASDDVLSGEVSQDPDQTFDPQDPTGTTAVPLTLANDTAYLRIEYVLDTSDDIDLYLYKDGTQVASSTAGGTNELIELMNPEPGDYTLYVHGWQVASSPTPFNIDHWQVVSGQGSPALMADPTSASTSTAVPFQVTASWDGAPAGVSYGVVNHLMNGAVGGQTVVQVTN